METRIAVVALVAGCGRISFDPLGSSVAACVPAGTEICNGIDDDCDGAIDEGCPCTPFDITVPGGGNSGATALAWTGSGYLGSLDNSVDVEVAAFGADGTVGGGVSIAQSGNMPAYAWSGSTLAALWTDFSVGNFYLGRFSSAPAELEPAIQLDAYPVSFAITWARGRFVIAAAIDGPIIQNVLRELGPDAQPTSNRIALPDVTSPVQTIAVGDAGV